MGFNPIQCQCTCGNDVKAVRHALVHAVCTDWGSTNISTADRDEQRETAENAGQPRFQWTQQRTALRMRVDKDAASAW